MSKLDFLLILIILFYCFTIIACFAYCRKVKTAARAKDTFIASVSHEMKTPLNSLMGNITLLEHTKLSQEQREIFEKLRFSADLLDSTVKSVLDFSKLKYKKPSFSPECLKLATIMDNMENLILPLIETRKLEFLRKYSFDDELTVFIDKFRLSQIIINLISNGVKNTKEGSITLSAEVMEEGEDTVKLLFSVKDTGQGIKAADLDRIFTPFEQLENSVTSPHQGTGLGLTIVRYLVDHMNGTLWVDSTPGEGSEFFFTICAPIGKEEELAETTEELSSLLSLDFNKRKILVVDDLEINYELLRDLLSKVNIICEHASNGHAALSLLSLAPCDYYSLILMDIQMPGMDGYTAARKIKKELNILTPILLLSAATMPQNIIHKNSHIIDGFISKPFKYTELLYVIASFCGLLPESKLPVCDSETAIENLGGNREIYEKHLDRFKVKYANIAQEIETCLYENNFEEGARLSHSVKGLAATLGFLELAEVASRLEELIRESMASPQWDTSAFAAGSLLFFHLEAFKEALKKTCN